MQNRQWPPAAAAGASLRAHSAVHGLLFGDEAVPTVVRSCGVGGCREGLASGLGWTADLLSPSFHRASLRSIL